MPWPPRRIAVARHSRSPTSPRPPPPFDCVRQRRLLARGCLPEQPIHPDEQTSDDQHDPQRDPADQRRPTQHPPHRQQDLHGGGVGAATCPCCPCRDASSQPPPAPPCPPSRTCGVPLPRPQRRDLLHLTSQHSQPPP